MFVFCPDYTLQSALTSFLLEDINILCCRDYGKEYFSKSIVCLDLDAYETSRTGVNDATMDAAIGIADWHRNCAVAKRHLLVELRFGYRSTSNFKLSNMKQKVSHSRDLLNAENIDKHVVFLYETNVAAQAKSYFSRLSMQDAEVRTWKAMDVESFDNYIVDSSTLPYLPENDLKEIESDFKKKNEDGDLVSIEVWVRYWMEQMEGYNLRYKCAEADAIAKVILKCLHTLTCAQGSSEKEYFSLLSDDVKKFIKN